MQYIPAKSDESVNAELHEVKDKRKRLNKSLQELLAWFIPQDQRGKLRYETNSLVKSSRTIEV